MRFKGKSAVVTGGAIGMGRAMALQLGREGAQVAVCGRRADAVQEFVDELHSKKIEALGVSCDVSNPSQVDSFFGEVVKAFGKIDILVNNAGIGGPNPIADGDDNRWRSILSINLDGVYYCCRAAVPVMPDGGRIVNISSVLGRFGVPGYTGYCASKHGVIGLTKALALELAPRRITVNAICPGWVETDMARLGMESGAKAAGISYEEFRRKALAYVPLRDIIQPEEIAEMVCFLASDAARSITAQSYAVCGGQVML